MSTQLGPIDFDELKTLQFSFANELESGKTIVSVAISITVKQGTDTSPSNRLLGIPVVSGTSVLQRVQPLIPDVVYHLRARAVDSDGNAHVVSGDLTVVAI